MVARRLTLAVALVVLTTLGFAAGYAAYPLVHSVGVLSWPQLAAETADPVDMSGYWQVWNLLDRDFYGNKPAAQDRTYAAIAGMVESFADPYTLFVEPQARELERDQLAGKFGGIGAAIEVDAAGFLLRPLPDQPAAQAGIQDGDRLLRVDAQPISTTLTLDQVIALVRGEPGTLVTLVILRTQDGQLPQEITVVVTRAEIVTPSMEWRMLDDDPQTADVGYIRHTIFSERSAAEMRQAIDELIRQGARRFIWDLRGNPGGLLSAAVETADMWLEEGTILVEEKADGTRKTLAATPGDLTANAPLVVMVDGGSASAAEIVAGALRDQGRARLVGARTFGKGSVQLIHELADRSSLHVTNAHWLTPRGDQITGQGLTPEVTVAEGEDPLPAALAALPSMQEARRPGEAPAVQE